MNKSEFIEKFAEALFADASTMSGETEFRTLDEWSSLTYLSVIAMLDEDYDTQIENVDFKNLKTLNDIMDYIESNK